MNISARYFNHGSTYKGEGAQFIASCLNCPKTPIIKPHAVCIEVPIFDLQDLLKNIVQKEPSCAIYTCNLMLYLLMGEPVIYVCSNCCYSLLFWCHRLQQNISGPPQSMPLVSLINLLSVAWFFSTRCFPPIRKGCYNQTITEWRALHLTYSSSCLSRSEPHDFWRLDYWEDDLRRRRRFVRNPFGSTHLDITCKSLQEYSEFIILLWDLLDKLNLEAGISRTSLPNIKCNAILNINVAIKSL